MQDLLLSAKHLFVGARPFEVLVALMGWARGLPTMGQVGQQRGRRAGKRAAFYFSSRKHSAVMPMSANAKRHLRSRSALISSSVGSRPSRFRNRSMVVSVNSIPLPPLWFRLLVASPCVRDLLLWSMPSCAWCAE